VKRRFLNYAGSDGDERDANLKCIRLAMSSVANTVITPMQDLLGFGAEGRMNTPSAPTGNWEWRMLREEMDARRFAHIATMTQFYGRG
jgi:4-alpha-glucanotransferase